jgi:predicted dithiol-disulfide oxidoreductase (DUF899 family)
MFEPASDDGCPSCSAGADEISGGLLERPHARDTTLAYVSRAPLHKIEDYKARDGWAFPWYSSHGSDFNYDFHVTLDESVAPVEYTYRSAAEHAANGFSFFTDRAQQPFEMPGASFFPRRRRGLPHVLELRPRRRDDGGSYCFLDLTALSRQEDREEPQGRRPRRTRGARTSRHEPPARRMRRWP